jgi:hypothetical protein
MPGSGQGLVQEPELRRAVGGDYYPQAVTHLLILMVALWQLEVRPVPVTGSRVTPDRDTG